MAAGYLATFTEAELLAAGAACCLAACEYSSEASDGAAAARLATRARAILTAPGALSATQVKDLGLRLLKAAQ